uniref:Secreted protein n=1 Tax=Mesocestoides corti TaxID=53468 RepID=A0A5K3G2V7_MESCO
MSVAPGSVESSNGGTTSGCVVEADVDASVSVEMSVAPGSVESSNGGTTSGC